MKTLERDDRIIIKNGDGDWHLDKVRGHIIKFKENGRGRTVVFDNLERRGPDPHAPMGLNDPRAGGLGAFGVHVARDLSGTPWDKTWETNTRMVSDEDGFGISHSELVVRDNTFRHRGLLHDPFNEPLFKIERTYTVYDHAIRLLTTVHELGQDVWIKEPKLTFALGVPGGLEYEEAVAFDTADRELSRRAFVNLPDPWVKTWQIRDPLRYRLQFLPPPTAKGFHLIHDHSGFSAWASAADERDRFSNDCKPYCLQGPPYGKLSRAWELAKRRTEPDVNVMFHAWEGGAGPSDCLCAARKLGTGTWSVTTTFSYGPGAREI